MCTPSMPTMPDPPKPLDPPPPPLPMPDPEAPTPPPELVPSSEGDVAIKQRNTARQQQQQSSKGAGSLRIPLGTGAASGKQAKTGLSIPK